MDHGVALPDICFRYPDVEIKENKRLLIKNGNNGGGGCIRIYYIIMSDKGNFKLKQISDHPVGS
jgi:hypothetical protein